MKNEKSVELGNEPPSGSYIFVLMKIRNPPPLAVVMY